MLEPWEELRPTWRRCAVGRTGWLWSERLPHGSFEEPDKEIVDLFKRRSGTVVNPTCPRWTTWQRKWHSLADLATTSEEKMQDTITIESERNLWLFFGRNDCDMFSYTEGSPLCRIRWSRLQTHSNVWKGEWPEEIARHVILGHLSIFVGITWNNNWVPEWRKPKKTVAWGCQCLHYTLNMVWSNIR